MKKPADITSYKPENDSIANKIDVEKYLVDSNVMPEKPDNTFVDENHLFSRMWTIDDPAKRPKNLHL